MELAKAMVIEQKSSGSSTLLAEREEPSYKYYLEKIGRSDLKEILTPKTPYVSVSLEVGVDKMPFTGGLGILEGDKLLEAELSGLPYTALTLAYSRRWNQSMDDYWQQENFETITPEDLDLERIGKTSVTIIGWNGEEIVKEIDICRKRFGNAQLVALYMGDLREVYYGDNDSEHRLFQQVVLGFGGQAAMEQQGISPSLLQVNESAPSFCALAYLDKQVTGGVSFSEALEATRRKTLYTNHTLVTAALSAFSREYFERLVIPNIKTEDVRSWLRGLIDHEGGHLDLNLLAFELAGRYNGVSKTHAEFSSFQYKKIDGSDIQFEANTNGIFMGRWAHWRFLDDYLSNRIIDRDHLMVPEAKRAIDDLDYDLRLDIKRQAKEELRGYLRRRVDQDGRSIDIPEESKIAVWSRRLARYKQPFMVLSNPDELAKILEEEDMHLVISGKVHEKDQSMHKHLRDELYVIRNHPILSRRVHFVQNYDVPLAEHLFAGADISLHTPRPGEEACGTSPWKAIINDTIVVSTEDGGLADKKPASYIKIEGDDIYDRLRQASREVDSHEARIKRVKGQLSDYLEIIPSGQMQARYIDLGYPQEELPQAA